MKYKNVIGESSHFISLTFSNMTKKNVMEYSLFIKILKLYNISYRLYKSVSVTTPERLIYVTIDKNDTSRKILNNFLGVTF